MVLASVSDGLTNSNISLPSVDNVNTDDSDLDGDSETDSYVLASWASLFGQWPGSTSEVLFTLTFDLQ